MKISIKKDFWNEQSVVVWRQRYARKNFNMAIFGSILIGYSLLSTWSYLLFVLGLIMMLSGISRSKVKTTNDDVSPATAQ